MVIRTADICLKTNKLNFNSQKINAIENGFSVDVSAFETGIYAYQFFGEKMEMEVGKVLVLE